MKLLRSIFILIFGNTNKNFSEKVIWSFALQILSTASVFLSNLVLTRVMDISDYGVYSFAFSLATMLSTIATSGFVNLLLRKCAEYTSAGKYEQMKGLLTWTNNRVLISNAVIVIIYWIIFYFFPVIPEEQKMTVLIVSFAIPLSSAIIIYQSALNGAGHVIEWQIPEKIVKPVLIIVISAAYFFTCGQISSVTGTIIHVLTFFVAVVFTFIYMKKKISPLTDKVAVVHEQNEWLNSFYYFLILSVVAAVSSKINVLMLGFMERPPEEVAVFNIATRIAEAISFSLLAVNISLAPAISGLYSSGKKEELQQLVFKYIRIATLFALVLLVVFCFAGKYILLIFGEKYTPGYTALIILSLGYFAGVIPGAAGYLLLMTGNEKPALFAVIISTIINVVLCYCLIPLWGVNGAAIASCICMIIWNVYMAVAAKMKTGINPTCIG